MKQLSLALIGLLLFSCSTTKEPAITSHFNADELKISWKANNNFHKEEFNYLNTLTITNTSDKDSLPSTGWTIYFNQMPKNLIEVPENITITHINGDFFSLSPNDKTGSIAAGASFEIPYVCNDWVIKNSDAPVGFYIVFDGDEKPYAINNYEIAPFETDAQTKRFDGDNMAVTTPESRFDQFAQLTELPKNELPPFIPTPTNYRWGNGNYTLSAASTISAPTSLDNEKEVLVSLLKEQTGIQIQETEEGSISLSINDNLEPEAYTIAITSEQIDIQGGSPTGVFYGTQSLFALLPTEAFNQSVSSLSIRSVAIEDNPRFGYRGMELDVGRNFHKKEAIMKLLNYMAFYKLNKFHWHLSDDEGWRIEIPTLPELTSVGAFRGHTLDESTHLMPAYGSGPDKDNSVGSGFYSKEDFIEILKFANSRHIEIIPELDMPGHMRAAIKAMDARYNRLIEEGKTEEAEAYQIRDMRDSSEYRSVQWYNDNVMCVCKEPAYTFIETVITDIEGMYTEAGLQLKTFHIGADEVPNGVWEKSPLCNALAEKEGISTKADLTYYFLKRYAEILDNHNITMGGWEEIGMIESPEGKGHVVNPDFATKNTMPYVWNNVWGWGMEDFAYKLANQGYDVVLSNATNLYFDLAYNKDPEEPGYYWAGFCNARTTYEFTPMNIFNSAYTDRMGNELNDSLWSNKVRLTEEGRSHIQGIQGQLWSETVRSPEMLEYYLFPKLIGLAERAWSQQPGWATIGNKEDRLEALNSDWNIFSNQIGQIELPRMNNLFGGVNYRQVTGEKDGEKNCEFPGGCQ